MTYKPNYRDDYQHQVPLDYVRPKKPIATELGIQQAVSKFCRENDLAISPENTKVFRDGIEKEHDGIWSAENLHAVMRQRSTEFRREVLIKTSPRPVSTEEVLAMAQQVMAANPWIADTPRNGELIANAFLDDSNIKRDLPSMIGAIERIKNQLDLNRPEPPPKSVYDEGPLKPLSDGSLPLPLDTPEWRMRSSSVSNEQMRDLVARLRKKELWAKQNEDIPA